MDRRSQSSEYDIYFGTNADAVANANKSSPEYKGTNARGDERYDLGKLEGFTQYFWRIDEVNDVNPDSPWIGNVWNFTTAHNDFVVIDDFESYTNNDAAGQAIWQSWIDGIDDPDNGALVGYLEQTYVETDIVSTGFQSMPYFYGVDGAQISEAKFTLSESIDLTSGRFDSIILFVHGKLGNNPGILYINFEDGAGNVGVIQHEDPQILTIDKWSLWAIPVISILESSEMNITSIRKISIGVRTTENYIIRSGRSVFANRIQQVNNAKGQFYIDAVIAAGPLFGVTMGYVWDKNPNVAYPGITVKLETEGYSHYPPSDSEGFYAIFAIRKNTPYTASLWKNKTFLKRFSGKDGVDLSSIVCYKDFILP